MAVLGLLSLCAFFLSVLHPICISLWSFLKHLLLDILYIFIVKKKFCASHLPVLIPFHISLVVFSLWSFFV